MSLCLCVQHCYNPAAGVGAVPAVSGLPCDLHLHMSRCANPVGCAGHFLRGFGEGGLSARCHHKLRAFVTGDNELSGVCLGVSCRALLGKEGTVAADRPPQLMTNFLSLLKTPLTRRGLLELSGFFFFFPNWTFILFNLKYLTFPLFQVPLWTWSFAIS